MSSVTSPTKTYRTFDKSVWGDGPWVGEPDKLQWQDKATRLPCLIVRNIGVTGALCGYVGVAEGHPDFAKPCDEVDVHVHGGLTFAAFCDPRADEEHGICHVPAPGEPDHVWWLGFDCAHAGDVSPAMKATMRKYGFTETTSNWEKYRPINYVKAQCARLAKQLAARSAPA